MQDPLLVASINFGDDKTTIKKKLDFVARFIETFTVRRAVNYRKFGQTSIRYTMFNLIKVIRNNDLQTLGNNLKNEINEFDQKWDAVDEFRLHGQNGKFVKHLLSRVSSYIDNIVGKDTNYVTYHHPKGKQFEIEHIWGNKFEEHKDEFEQKKIFRNGETLSEH